MLSACNSTKFFIKTELSGVVDTKYRGNFQAKKMIIMTYGMPINEQKIFEYNLKNLLFKYDIELLEGLEIFPPTRNYSDQDIYQIAKTKDADSILMLNVSRILSEKYVPPTYHPAKSISHISGNGIFTTIETYTSPSYMSSGYSISNPVMNLKLDLRNTENKEVIWKAEGLSFGGSNVSFSQLVESVAKKIVEELSKENLVVKKNIP